MTTVTIQKLKREIKKELLQEFVLPMLRKVAPTYYLGEKEAKKIDKLVNAGLKELRAGKTKAIASLADLE